MGTDTEADACDGVTFGFGLMPQCPVQLCLNGVNITQKSLEMLLRHSANQVKESFLG